MSKQYNRRIKKARARKRLKRKKKQLKELLTQKKIKK